MIDHLIRKHQSRAILLDANVLLLDVVGGLDRNLIETFKRTRQFTVDDYQRLQRLLSQFNGAVTTPNVLTEVSNLGSQLPVERANLFREALAARIKVLDEKYLASALVGEHAYFIPLGISDAGLAMLAEDGLLVLTMDFHLANRIQHSGLDVINFNHLRVLK